jgi:hypothetical protein
MLSAWPGAAGSLGAELSESEAAWRVFIAAGGLVLLGVVLLVATVWWWRSTRPEPPALGPLEVMGARRWTSASPAERTRLLDGNRPAGASSAPVEPETVDLSLIARRDPAAFDDLRDPVDPPVAPELDPEAAEVAARSAALADPAAPDPETPGTDAGQAVDHEVDATVAMPSPAEPSSPRGGV